MTGRNPTDRNGMPLHAMISGAEIHDSMLSEQLLEIDRRGPRAESGGRRRNTRTRAEDETELGRVCRVVGCTLATLLDPMSPRCPTLGRVRLYLSSFRLGLHEQRLLRLLGSGRRTALVPNALDGLPAADRAMGVQRDVEELGAAGLAVTVVDLRIPGAAAGLAGYDLVWIRGGNVFALRRALADSGADELLVALLQQDLVVYGGYSAGACVLGPDLTELKRVDDPTAVTPLVTAGLGLLDRPFVPHLDSPGHPESVLCGTVATAYTARGQAHWALRDGEVLLVNDQVVELLGR